MGIIMILGNQIYGPTINVIVTDNNGWIVSSSGNLLKVFLDEDHVIAEVRRFIEQTRNYGSDDAKNEAATWPGLQPQ
jgi:hypothetical protein